MVHIQLVAPLLLFTKPTNCPPGIVSGVAVKCAFGVAAPSTTTVAGKVWPHALDTLQVYVTEPGVTSMFALAFVPRPLLHAYVYGALPPVAIAVILAVLPEH